MEEIYKAIDGYDNYTVSNLGNIKNIKTNRVLKSDITENGYCRIKLNDGKNIRIHILVGKAFIPNVENKLYIDHIDRVKTNNNVENLRWVTRQENMMNQNKSKNNKSGYIGVYKDNNLWSSELTMKGIKYSKKFKTIEEAIEYRKELEITHFGIYAPQ